MPPARVPTERLHQPTCSTLDRPRAPPGDHRRHGLHRGALRGRPLLLPARLCYPLDPNCSTSLLELLVTPPRFLTAWVLRGATRAVGVGGSAQFYFLCAKGILPSVSRLADPLFYSAGSGPFAFPGYSKPHSTRSQPTTKAPTTRVFPLSAARAHPLSFMLGCFVLLVLLHSCFLAACPVLFNTPCSKRIFPASAAEQKQWTQTAIHGADPGPRRAQVRPAAG